MANRQYTSDKYNYCATYFEFKCNWLGSIVIKFLPYVATKKRRTKYIDPLTSMLHYWSKVQFQWSVYLLLHSFHLDMPKLITVTVRGRGYWLAVGSPGVLLAYVGILALPLCCPSLLAFLDFFLSHTHLRRHSLKTLISRLCASCPILCPAQVDINHPHTPHLLRYFTRITCGGNRESKTNGSGLNTQS